MVLYVLSLLSQRRICPNHSFFFSLFVEEINIRSFRAMHSSGDTKPLQSQASKDKVSHPLPRGQSADTQTSNCSGLVELARKSTASASRG